MPKFIFQFDAVLRHRKTIEEQQRFDLAKTAGLVRDYASGLTVEAYFARKVDGKVRFERVEV